MGGRRQLQPALSSYSQHSQWLRIASQPLKMFQVELPTKPDFQFTSATATAEGLIIEDTDGTRLVAWRNLENLSLRDDLSCARPYQLEVSYRDAERPRKHPFVLKALVDFETRTRRLLFVTRCRQLGARVSYVGAPLEGEPAASRPGLLLRGRNAYQDGGLPKSAREANHLSVTRNCWDARGPGDASSEASCSQFSIIPPPAPQPEEAQSLPYARNGQQTAPIKQGCRLRPRQGGQQAKCKQSDCLPGETTVSCTYLERTSSLEEAPKGINSKDDCGRRRAKNLSAFSFRRPDPAPCESVLGSSCNAIQIAGKAIIPGYPNADCPYTDAAIQNLCHVPSGLPPSDRALLPSPLPRSDLLPHTTLRLLDPTELFEGGLEPDDISEGGAPHRTSPNALQTTPDLALAPPQKSKKGSALIRLIRAGAKLFRRGKNRSSRDFADDNAVPTEGFSKHAAVSAAEPHLTRASIAVRGRRRRFSMPAFVSAVNSSFSFGGRSRSRCSAWNGGIRERPSRSIHTLAATSDHATPAIQATKPGPTPEQAAALVGAEAEKNTSGCPVVQPCGSDTETVCGKLTVRPKLCWRKPVMPPFRRSPTRVAGVTTPAVRRRHSSDTASDASVVVVSLASGESSATSWEDQKEAFRNRKRTGPGLGNGFLQGAEADGLSDGSASYVLVDIVPAARVTPASSRQRTPHPQRSVASSRATRHATEIKGSTNELPLARRFGTARGLSHDFPLSSDSSYSEAEISICQTPKRSTDIQDIATTPCFTSHAEPLLVEEYVSPQPGSSSNQVACDTMQFCKLPDNPGVKGECLFSESVTVEAAIFPVDATDADAPLLQGINSGGAAAPSTNLAAPHARHAHSIKNDPSQDLFSDASIKAPSSCVQCTELSSVRGRVLVETDDEGTFTPKAFFETRLDSPCSPPVGICISVPPQTDVNESESLRTTLTTLWEELEAAHKGDGIERRSPVEGSSIFSTPQIGTWEHFQPHDEAQAPHQSTDAPVFSDSAAHSTFMSILGGSLSGTKKPGKALESLKTLSKKTGRPSCADRVETALQRKSTEDEFGSDWGLGEKDLEELVEEGDEELPQLTVDPVAPPPVRKDSRPKHSAFQGGLPGYGTSAPKPDKESEAHENPLAKVVQDPGDSASVASEIITRLKENLNEQAESWWRTSMRKVANRPLLASYETSSKDKLSITSEIQEELAPGPNENSILSSNWHDRLQWTFQQVLTVRESQEYKPDSYLRRKLFERELALSHEIGSFAAAARAAAVVLLYSRACGKNNDYRKKSQPELQDRQSRKGPAQCFVRITPEEYPTVWSVYRPKFASDEVYVFDSLVFTVIVGDIQANIKLHYAKEVYQNDVKGRQAMADAVYATSLARKHETDMKLRTCGQLRHVQVKDLVQQVDTVWNAHGQAKFERAKLGLPIACLVDYAGLSVLVEPLLPLNPAPVNVLEELTDEIRRCLPDFVRQCESIGNLFGCFDALDKVDRAAYNKFKNIARFLNLADYPFARGASDFEDPPLPPAALWRSQTDHFCIFRNLHETLPPKCAGGRVIPEQRFRQRFVSRVFDVALPCTSREQHKASETSGSKFVQRNTILRGSLEALEVAEHSLGLAIKQDLVPAINRLQKNFLDSFDIAHTLHAHGINIRNVAQLLNHGPASPFRDAIVREVVARCAKRLFRLQIEELTQVKLFETSHMEEMQRLVVTLFNLVLSTNEESRIFWLHQILPLALERYKLDLTDLASPESMCTYSLFKAMEYNLGVQFDSHVAVPSTDGSRETTLELRLPLTVSDLSTFTTPRDSVLFPHISHVRAALLCSGQADTAAGETDWQLPRDKTTKWRMRHLFENGDGEKENEDTDRLKAASTIEELQTFAELRAVRGFYPRLHLVAPETFALMQAAVSSTEVGASSISLDILLENMKACLVVPTLREDIWGSGNFAMHSACGAIRSALMGTGYPCHPYCLAMDEDEQLHSEVTYIADECKSQFPLKQCLRYKRKKLGLTLALLLKAAIGSDILLLGKILQQTAYVMMQHNENKAASSIADFIFTKIPDALSLQSEALLIDMQCTTKGSHPQDALMSYRSLKPILIAMEGKMSLRLLLVDLLLASFAFKNKRFNAAILHAFRVHKISTVCFDTGGAHWAAIAALRLIARSMLEVQRCSEAIIILQHAVRAASTNPELPTLVTHMSRFWLASAFARMGRLENASVEAQSMLTGLETQLGTNHEATMSALYLAADVKMRIGCLALQNPPLKIERADSQGEEKSISGAPGELQEPLLWKPLRADDFEIYEGIFGDRGMMQARADAEQLFLALFRRLLFREDNVLVEVYQPPGLQRKQRLRQIFSTLKQILKLKLCSIPIAILRLLAHRIYVACVTQGCSKSMRPFGLMEQEHTAAVFESADSEDEETKEDERRLRHKHMSADRSRVYFTKYPRLHVGWKPISADSASRVAEASVCRQGGDSGAVKPPQQPQGDHSDYPFSFYSQQKLSGTERRRAQDNNFLYACVDGSSGMRPTQEHDDVMLQLLLFCEGPPSLNGVLKSCYMCCMEDRERTPASWIDDLLADVLNERGSLQHLRFLLCLLRHFFTLSQKSLFIALAPGDFNRKRHAQILIQTMRGEHIEGDVSRKLLLKRMINKSREKMPDSTEDFFEYEINSPRQFDLMVGISRCEELLNATTWTGSALRRMGSQLEYTLSKQLLTQRGPSYEWQPLTGGDDDLVEGTWGEAGQSSKAARDGNAVSFSQKATAAVEENYLRLPPIGEGNISGKTLWKSMSTAARLSQQRFGGNNQFTASASPVAYGVMSNILRPQDDSALEAFGCIECLQPADKVPYLGG